MPDVLPGSVILLWKTPDQVLPVLQRSPHVGNSIGLNLPLQVYSPFRVMVSRQFVNLFLSEGSLCPFVTFVLIVPGKHDQFHYLPTQAVLFLPNFLFPELEWLTHFLFAQSNR